MQTEEYYCYLVSIQNIIRNSLIISTFTWEIIVSVVYDTIKITRKFLERVEYFAISYISII